jgi:heat shock protein HspQ
MSDAQPPETPHAEAMPSELAALVARAGPPVVDPNAHFTIGQVVKHRFFPFRGVIYDVDPTFNNSEDWWLSIPSEMRPAKEQPFYHLLAENEQTSYVAYVSQQNLVPDDSGDPVNHPSVKELFGTRRKNGIYLPKRDRIH